MMNGMTACLPVFSSSDEENQANQGGGVFLPMKLKRYLMGTKKTDAR